MAEDLVELRQEMLDLKEQNIKLREEARSLQEKLSLQSKIAFEKGVYWIEEDEMTKDKTKTPICPRCWDMDKTVVRQRIDIHGESTGFHCSNCGKFFEVG